MHKFPVVSPPFPQSLSCEAFVVFRGHQCMPAGKLPPTQSDPLCHWFKPDAGQDKCSVLQPGHQPWGPQASCWCPDLLQHRGHTGSQPEVIQPQANFLWLLCSSPPPSCWECFHLRQWQRLAEPRNHLLQFLLWHFPGRTRNPSLLPPPILQIGMASLDNFQQVSHMSE